MNYFDRLHYDQETGALTWAVRAPGVRIANKVVYHVGYFRTPEEAHEAYMRLKARLHLGGRSH